MAPVSGSEIGGHSQVSLGPPGLGRAEWILDPAVQLQQLAASPEAEDLPSHQPADQNGLLLRIRLGPLPNQVAGDYGSQQRIHYEEGLVLALFYSPAYGFDTQLNLNTVILGYRHHQKGTPQSMAELTIRRDSDTHGPQVAADSWTREGVMIEGQRLSVEYGPSPRPLGALRLIIHKPPPSCCVQGLTSALLTSAGYRDGQVKVLTEFMGTVKLQNQVVVGLGSLDNIVAWVVPPLADPRLLALPDHFRMEDTTVRLFVEGREGSRFSEGFLSMPSLPQQMQGPASPRITSQPPPAPIHPQAPSPPSAPAPGPADMEVQISDPHCATPSVNHHSHGHVGGRPEVPVARTASPEIPWNPPAQPRGVAAMEVCEQVSAEQQGLPGSAGTDAGLTHMDVDSHSRGLAPAPSIAALRSSGPPGGQGSFEGMHPARMARLGHAALTPRPPPQPAPPPLQPPPHTSGEAAHAAAARAAQHLGPRCRQPGDGAYQRWAKGIAAQNILSQLGYALEDLPKVDETGGKEGAFRAFYAFCTQGASSSTLLSRWEKEWMTQSPGVGTALPSWVRAWLRARYGEPDYGSGGSELEGHRSRSRSRGGRRRGPGSGRGRKGAGAGPSGSQQSKTQPHHHHQQPPEAAQQTGTLLRSGRFSRPPDLARSYGGQAHA